MKLSKARLGIRGEASEVRGHNDSGIEGVGGVGRSSGDGGLDRDETLAEVENNLVRLFFVLRGFKGDEAPPGAVNGPPDLGPPTSMVRFLSSSIDFVRPLLPTAVVSLKVEPTSARC